MSNQTKSVAGGNSKIDCAKECPCGVPVIPVPDQWLEVMVTGGFKVWHIIFIIIAFVVTLIVVYCCFHRCRIPRTKQEIEADLMRTNITNKFRDYLQNLPNEPTSFLEALKKVQDLEEKSEKDDAEMARDAGARKRLGWLKLKGKGDKEAAGGGQAPKGDNNGEPPEDGPLVGLEGEKAAIPEPAPAAAAAQQTIQLEPAALIGPEPSPEATQPKGLASSTVVETGEQETKMKPPRRRKQKPNLSRSKRAREHPNGDAKSHWSPDMVEAIERPPPLEVPADPKHSPAERPADKAPRRHPPKQHTHRVRIEPKATTTGPPPDV